MIYAQYLELRTMAAVSSQGDMIRMRPTSACQAYAEYNAIEQTTTGLLTPFRYLPTT